MYVYTFFLIEISSFRVHLPNNMIFVSYFPTFMQNTDTEWKTKATVLQNQTPSNNNITFSTRVSHGIIKKVRFVFSHFSNLKVFFKFEKKF